jgi:proteasome lid subunit RPN8/RPN11
VSIGKPVNDKIVQAARGNKNEIVGLLLGRLEGNTLIIENSITGESSAAPHRVSLSSNALAKIADGLVTGLIKGNIVGWYHSHTVGGLFFSPTDIGTQRTLQQFSKLVVGMVVDTSTGEVGFFRVDHRTGEAVRLPAERISVFSGVYAATRQETIAPSISVPTLEVEGVTPSMMPRALGVFGAVGPVIYLSALLLGGFLWPSYSQYYDTVSTLTSAASPVQVRDVTLLLFGLYNVCVILLAVGLYYGIEGGHIWGPVSLLSTGALGLALFLFPQDYPQGFPVTITGTIHVVLAGVATFLSLAAMAFFWRHFSRDPHWKHYSHFSIAMLPISSALAVFVLISISAPYQGLAERLWIGSILFWMEVVSIRLIFPRMTSNTSTNSAVLAGSMELPVQMSGRFIERHIPEVIRGLMPYFSIPSSS